MELCLQPIKIMIWMESYKEIVMDEHVAFCIGAILAFLVTSVVWTIPFSILFDKANLYKTLYEIEKMRNK